MSNTLRLATERLRHFVARSGPVTLLIVATLACGLNAAGQTRVQGNRSPVNAEEFDRLFQQVKNWGRWGAEDQLGLG